MNRTLVALFAVAFSVQGFGAPPAASVRTIRNVPDFPMESLRVGIGRPLFRSLQVSPISAYVVARASLVSGHAGNAKIIHEEGNGVYDQMLLEIANGYSVSGQNTIETRIQGDSLDVHLLIYDIKDGKMAVCFSHTADARYADYRQGGVAWVGISQGGGKWNTISGKAETKWGGRR